MTIANADFGGRFDRFDYGAFRRGWRAAYADLTARIRKTKVECKEAQRASGGAAPGSQASLASLRKEAAAMMERRTEVDTLRREMAVRMGLVRPRAPRVAKAA